MFSQTVASLKSSKAKFPPFIGSVTITSVAAEGEGQPPIVTITLYEVVPISGLGGV